MALKTRSKWHPVSVFVAAAATALACVVVWLASCAFAGQSPFGWELRQFVPDLAVGLTTGGLIAGSIFWLENRARVSADSRAVREEAEDEWDRARPRLRAALEAWTPQYLNWTANKTPLDLMDLVELFVQVSKEYPLRRWAKAWPENAEIVAAAKVSEALWAYDPIAAQVEARYKKLCGNHWHASAIELVSIFQIGSLESLRAGDHYQPPEAFSEPIFGDAKVLWRVVTDRWQEARAALAASSES